MSCRNKKFRWGFDAEWFCVPNNHLSSDSANKVTVSCDELRPGGQTAVKVTNPSVNTATGNEVIIYTTNSSFASYVGKEAVAHLTFTYS